MQTEGNYELVPLDQIKPPTFGTNPRTDFTGPGFDELVNSIRQKGVIQPIVLRKNEKTETLELVCGERRVRASKIVAKENGGKSTPIPAIVRKLTEKEAWDIMVIENIQRESLSPIEEARAFAEFLNRDVGKKDAAKELSERTGLNYGFINRRAKLMELPQVVLDKWNEGKLALGHLEQFLRLIENKEDLNGKWF